jgi:O-methyltransferase involved in polyketide biosynthesis
MSERISPTAYATGYLWYRLGLSHPVFATRRGRRLDFIFNRITRAVGFSFDNMMLARHGGIDALLTRAIDAGEITQVIEIAAGLSGRGLRFMRKYGDKLIYLETDLPAMARLKRRLLTEAGVLNSRHRVLELDALAESGSQSLASIADTLDPNAGTAVITEGLMNYLEPEIARGVWRRVAACLARFPRGLYLSDAYFSTENHGLPARIIGKALQAFVRGRMHIHFNSAAHGAQMMRELGFAHAWVHEIRSLPETNEAGRRPGGDKVRVLEARVPA